MVEYFVGLVATVLAGFIDRVVHIAEHRPWRAVDIRLRWRLDDQSSRTILVFLPGERADNAEFAFQFARYRYFFASLDPRRDKMEVAAHQALGRRRDILGHDARSCDLAIYPVP